jgi:hypothetical protein
MEIPYEDIIERIETIQIFIGDPDNLSSTIHNMAVRLEITDLIKAQAKEILDLQATIVRIRTEKTGAR